MPVDPAQTAHAQERLARALPLVDHVHRDVQETIALSTALLEESEADEAACVGLRALGQALKQSGELPAARDALTRAVGLADRLGLPVRVAQVRTSLVIILADMGDTNEAFAQADLAGATLIEFGEALDLARLQVNRGLVLLRTGRADEALALLAEAEPVLEAHEDARWEALLLNLRGPLLAYRGEYPAAVRDLTRARQLAEAHGYRLLSQVVSQSLGFVAAEAGDIPLALRELEQAYDLAVELGKPTHWALVGLAEALLTVGRAQEAQKSAAQAAKHLETGHIKYNAAEARLIEARAALQHGDASTAAVSAGLARDAFTRQRRPGWAAWAQHVALAARYAEGERSVRLLNALQTNAERLAEAGWLAEPQQATLLAARTAVALNRGDLGARLYADVAGHRKAGPAHLRMLGWEAHAELAEHLGQPGPAAQSVAGGLKVAAQYASTLGATDLRAAAAGLGGNLAKIGVRLALAPGGSGASRRSGVQGAPGAARTATAPGRSGSGKAAATLLIRAEQWRATTLRRRPVRPLENELFGDRLVALRAVNAQISVDGSEGRPVRTMQTERVRLEREITRLARQTPGNALDPNTAHERPLDLRQLRAALEDRALIEYLHFENRLFAISYVAGRARRHDLGPYAAVLTELESLRFSMNSLARNYGSPAVREAVRAAYDHARTVLDAILLRPMAADIGSRTVVLVPTGSLHALAWPVLPSLAGRPCTITPSARSWLAGAAPDPASTDPTVPRPPSPTSPSPSALPLRTAAPYGSVPAQADPSALGRPVLDERSVLLAYGPGLLRADGEIRAIAAHYPHAKPLLGPDATASAVARGLDGAYLAHLATHGKFRAENPLFSSLELADGPLTVYELEQLGRCPQILILSSCDTALSGVSPGDELMGVASAVFALGTRTLIASVAKVADDAAAELMLSLHRALVAGSEPADALALAELEVPNAPGFICLGTR